MSRQVYIPVAVTFDDNGNLERIETDFEGAPWSYVDKGNNVWIVEAEGEDGYWDTDSEVEGRAIELLQARLESTQAAV